MGYSRKSGLLETYTYKYYTKVMSNKKNKLIYILVGLILAEGMVILFLNDDLQYQRKNSLQSAQYCIKYTSDIIMNGSVELVNERSNHKADVDQANKNIEFLVDEYNKLVVKYNKINRDTKSKAKELLYYSFSIAKS
jgi:predicted metallo-beta-lactamase superfamily hydrolase